MDDNIYWSTLYGKYAGMYDELLRQYGNNPERSAYWYSVAAKQGHKQALFNLGIAYRNGNGVERNLVKATELIKTSAEQGESFAQLIYGDMFRDGEVCIRVVTDSIKGDAFIINVKPNIRLAKEWWRKALKNGNEKARERLEQVYEQTFKIPPKDKDEATSNRPSSAYLSIHDATKQTIEMTV